MTATVGATCGRTDGVAVKAGGTTMDGGTSGATTTATSAAAGISEEMTVGTSGAEKDSEGSTEVDVATSTVATASVAATAGSAEVITETSAVIVDSKAAILDSEATAGLVATADSTQAATVVVAIEGPMAEKTTVGVVTVTDTDEADRSRISVLIEVRDGRWREVAGRFHFVDKYEYELGIPRTTDSRKAKKPTRRQRY